MTLERLVLYELHVGTFTPEGTFDAVVPRLPELLDLGITALELMPVAQFPGKRNWGYDGVNPFAVQASYGGPDGLKRLVDACHGMGLAVVLDVVMNHLGPEGNYLGRFGPYFTDRYRTPWGEAVNFDGPESDEVRGYFLENARHWFECYHVDGLRLDAVHAIHDESARPFLAELAGEIGRLSETCGRPLHLIAESDRNDPRLVTPAEAGGLGLDALWLDDFHHALHTLLTREHDGYYADFGRLDQLAKCYREGFAYSGEPSAYRRRRHGATSAPLPGRSFVAFAQNHDQVGNRMLGERLASLVPFEALKLAAGAVVLSPFVPLLFMGEEYGEEAPFLYFVDHGDPDLLRAVREGRRAEFRSFGWEAEPPDPADPKTFGRSTLRWELRESGRHRPLRSFYRELLRLRREVPALASLDKESLRAVPGSDDTALAVARWSGGSRVAILMNPRPAPSRVRFPWGEWCFPRLLDAADARWGGAGSELPEILDAPVELRLPPFAFALYANGGTA